jgi:Ca2+-transporting ATPase
MASVLVRAPGALRLYNKGAADFFSTPHEDDLTALCLVGIKDPVRAAVPAAVATCQRAGIRVRMVTGDNIHTARHIARECGILTPGGVAIEGPDFRKMSEAEMLAFLPSLQVMARSSPQDKYVLVQALQRMGEVVAVTGDGTNDAPALKAADVGLAMGIAGTEVAKEAADIVILDDNFSSIVKSVLWGRCVFTNIRKFLQFQLTINLVALIIAFVAAVSTGETPLNVLQLLWVNLIMDSLAALALATENPTPDLLDRRPHGRNEPLISASMGRHILVQGLYQCFWLFLIFYGMPAQLAAFEVRPCPDPYPAGGEFKTCTDQQDHDKEQTNSMVFNTFIWCQMFNMINSRRIEDELNVFAGVLSGWVFPVVWLLIAAFQVVIMVVPAVGGIFSVQPQSLLEWAVAVAIGVGSLAVALAERVLARTICAATPEQRAAREAAAAMAPAVRYRQHFWEVMLPPKPKSMKAAPGGGSEPAATGGAATVVPLS